MSPSWYTDEWDRDSSADRYQAAHERQAREDRRLGVQPPTTSFGPVEESCGRCSYVIVDGACVGCGPWAQPSLSERAEIEANTAVTGVGRNWDRDLGAARSERDAA
jgi:hypothetical protein